MTNDHGAGQPRNGFLSQKARDHLWEQEMNFLRDYRELYDAAKLAWKAAYRQQQRWKAQVEKDGGDPYRGPMPETEATLAEWYFFRELNQHKRTIEQNMRQLQEDFAND